MIEDKALAEVLQTVGEGEMLPVGTLLKGLSDEKIVWVIIESVTVEDTLRVTLHAYWHDIFIVSKVVTITDGKLKWGVTKA